MVEWFKNLSDANKIAIVVPLGIAVIGLLKWLFGKKAGPRPQQKTIHQEGRGNYVEGDMIEVNGDYVKGDKNVDNYTTMVGGDVIQIENSLNSGSTGGFVNLVLNVGSFVEGRRAADPASVDDYLNWVQDKGEHASGNTHGNLLDVAERKDEQSLLVRDYIETVIGLVEGQGNSLREILQQTQLLPDMDSKLDYLVDQLQKSSPALQEGQVAVSARVLDILTRGIRGSGVKVIMKREPISHEGTVMVVWLLGTQSPHMMLVDLVGDIKRNRISVILNEDASIGLRAYDGAGHEIGAKSKSYPAGHRLVILGVWKDQDMSLWVNGELEGSLSLSRPFGYLGPACLFGIDIEGELSANAVRWSPEGQEVGLNFEKNGIWHGSRFDTVMIWERALDKSDIQTLAEDPWVMFREPK